ncbi:MAG: hypothetical protein ACI88C_003350, partial [Acidimicrobiales bacterium]
MGLVQRTNVILIVRPRRLEFMMNQRLQGPKLVLALLISAAMIGAAGFLAYGALSDDDQAIATGDDAAATAPTATSLPATQPAGPITAPGPTPLTLPTP